MDTTRRTNGDETQRARVARILADPAAYFAQARRVARDDARREIAARLAPAR